MNVLLTGFEPFRQFHTNSSWEAVRLVPACCEGVSSFLLPVDHVPAQVRLYELLEDLRPEICLLTGLANGGELRMEKAARRPTELEDLGGPERLEGAWPWPEMEAALAGQGLPLRLSEDAGSYVCESTYWALLAFRARHGFPRRAAFLHVPPLSAAISAERLAACVTAVVRASLDGGPTS